MTATFTAPAMDDPCADVSCPAMEQCLAAGPLAGNCAAIPEVIPDAGTYTAPPVASGCNTTGISGFGVLLLLGSLCIFAVRKAR